MQHTPPTRGMQALGALCHWRVSAACLVIIEEVLYSLNETVQLIVMHPMPGVGKSNYLNWTLEGLGATVGYWVRGPRFQTTN